MGYTKNVLCLSTATVHGVYRMHMLVHSRVMLDLDLPLMYVLRVLVRHDVDTTSPQRLGQEDCIMLLLSRN
jgi:hypothetical protein